MKFNSITDWNLRKITPYFSQFERQRNSNSDYAPLPEIAAGRPVLVDIPWCLTSARPPGLSPRIWATRKWKWVSWSRPLAAVPPRSARGYELAPWWRGSVSSTVWQYLFNVGRRKRISQLRAHESTSCYHVFSSTSLSILMLGLRVWLRRIVVAYEWFNNYKFPTTCKKKSIKSDVGQKNDVK